MNNLPQSVLDAIAQAEREGRVTVQGVGPLPGQHDGPAPGGGRTTPPKLRKVAAESEAAFQQRVIDLAHQHNWLVAHFRPARCVRPDGTVYYETPVQADGAGFPDLVLVRDIVIFAELKSDKGTVKIEQRAWLDRLHQANAYSVLWRPKDWELVTRILT